jgi:hypothetical protein
MKYILISVEDDKFDALLKHFNNLAGHPASSVVAAAEFVTDVIPEARHRVTVPEQETEQETEYTQNLRRIAADTSPLNRVARYRAQAELEDMDDDHWDGPRTDDPPENWQG